MLAGYREKIDIIYIDPPYNTKEMQSYADKFGRDGWLSMMKERLELARDLLTNEGVIFISLDDNEQAYLKILMDEIFGEQNFICNFIWEKNYQRKNHKGSMISINHDYIICYKKNNLEEFLRVNRTKKSDSNYKYDDNDGRGLYERSALTFEGQKGYDIKWNGKIYKEGNPSGWRFSEEDMYKLIKDNRIYLPANDKQVPRLKSYLNEKQGLITWTILNHNYEQHSNNKISYNSVLCFKNVGQNDDNQIHLDSIFGGERVFKHPKGIKLIKYLIKLVPNNEKAIILDFFAGTGTTGESVMSLNKEDNGNRKFILATNNEFIKKKENSKLIVTNKRISEVCYERLYRIMTGNAQKWKKNFTLKHEPYLKETLNYYDIKTKSVFLDKQTINTKAITEMIKDINNAYGWLAKDLNPLKINEENWFDQLAFLLTNANVALQDKNTKKQ